MSRLTERRAESGAWCVWLQICLAKRVSRRLAGRGGRRTDAARDLVERGPQRLLRIYAEAIRQRECRIECIAQFFLGRTTLLIGFHQLRPMRLIDHTRQLAAFLEETREIVQRWPIAAERQNGCVNGALRLRQCQRNRMIVYLVGAAVCAVGA